MTAQSVPWNDPQSRGEEWANLATHALGMLASLVAGVILTVYTVKNGDRWQITAAAVYSATLMLLYGSSTLYHSARDPVLRVRYKVLDHCAIYLLIAGTYTPFALIALHGTWGWWILGIIWGLAAAGVIFKLFFTGRFRLVSTIIYVVMGWLALTAIVPLARALSDWALAWLIAGGVTYTLGTVFYLAKRIPYSHAIWHLFVLGGSTCHFIAVCAQVV